MKYPFSPDIVLAVLDRFFPGNRIDGSGEVHGDNLPTQEEFAAKVAEYLEEERVIAIKAKARDVILSRYPEWKQANMTARFCELLAIESLSESEQAEKQALLNVWAWVKLVRAESDRLEGIAGATKDDGNWPA
jgi:hypothetical protein